MSVTSIVRRSREDVDELLARDRDDAAVGDVAARHRRHAASPSPRAEQAHERVLERSLRPIARRARRRCPCATTRPWPRMTMRSHSAATSCITCELNSRHLPLARKRAQQLAQRADAHDVEPVGGLVEQDRLRVVDQRARDRDLHPLALREALRAAIGDVARGRARASSSSMRASSASPREALQRAVVADVLARGEARVEAARVGQHADAPAHRVALARRRRGRRSLARAAVRDRSASRASAAASSCRRRWVRAGR